MPKSASKPTSRDGSNPHDESKSREEKAPIIEVVAEDDDQVEPSPPEVVEPNPALTPEEAERIRKEYLLTRFWISARGYWGRKGDRLGWPFSIGRFLLSVRTVGVQCGIRGWSR